MTTSVNQPRPVVRSSGGLFRVIGILALIVIAVAWLLNSYQAGKPIALDQPMPKGVDPVVEQTVTFSVAPPARCVDITKVVIFHGLTRQEAMHTPTNYVPCPGEDTPVDVAYKATKTADGYLLVDGDGDKFLCAAIPVEAGDIAQCKAVN